MKILLVHNFYRYRGGEETYFLSLKWLLKKNGHKIIIYTKDNRNIGSHLTSKLKVASSLFINREVERELFYLIKKQKPDIVHCNNIYPLISPTVYRVCKRFKIPIVQTIHNYRLICPGGTLFKNGRKCVHNNLNASLFHQLIHNCYRNSYIQSFVFSLSLLFHKIIGSYRGINVFIFPSDFTYRIYRRKLHIKSEQAEILPYFVRNNRTTNLAKKLDYKDYFLFSGRLSAEKGVIPLLNLFSTLPQIKLVVLGDGPLKKEIVKFRTFKNIVIRPFTSARVELFKYIRNALYTITTSTWYEVLPNIALESFSQGTPVIAPSLGVFKQLIQSESTGYKYTANNYATLKKVLLAAYTNKEKYKLMNQQTKELYRQKYTPKIHYSRLINIYKSLVEKSL